ncbi:tripartite tricarboxylate transporter substrate binding protein [Ramlibacter sp. WS9]|uniref:Bug family tripartite tricarboxylate transporter substrate binding protein n=1 Tax=Ramlibacter sp. WS9 TaxID=1882741 RepID=UPI00114437ED|nr:tripartite tricarboxylate transporter substrate binding protein [Ramlibacter sp. WS9]ROZ68783.1 tripartite tricarboxylate transporter substrate binding protein [Ramlibacter sp. WS9]
MKFKIRRQLISLAAAVPLMAAIGLAQAQHGDYPNRPVKIIVAYPAGQSTDIATRYFANKLSQAMGQSFVVENKPGASGNIGTTLAARATPDGYTLVMGANGTHAMNPALFDNPGFDAEKDFEPIVLTALIPFAISTGPNSNISSLNDLIASARKQPGKIDTALPSVTAQLIFEMLKQRDVPLFPVKFKGSADSMTALLGGHVHVLIDTVAATRNQLGKIKPLAVTTAAPMVSMPGVKTANEQGLPNFTISAWNALMAPKGVPADIHAKLAAEMRKIIDLPETQKALTDLGFERAPVMSNAELNAWLRDERRNYHQIVKTAQMKPE